MHSRWPELLEHLFQLRSEALRERLQSWPAAERAALFKAHKKDLQALRQACFFRPPRPGEENSADYNYLNPRYPRIATLYSELQPHLSQLADWLKQARISVWSATDAYTLFLNTDTCWALLCDARSASQLSKRLSEMPHAQHERIWHETRQGMTRKPDAPEPWVYSLTQALLWRQEAWADAQLENMFEQLTQHAEGGFYVAVCEALQQRPTQTLWPAYLGKALNLEIWIYREQLNQLPEAHLEALLSWVAPDTPELRHLEPLDYTEVQTFIQQRAQDPIWRKRLLPLILGRLQTHTRPARNLPWLKLWQSFAPQPTELLAYEATLLSLAHAPQSNVLQLGLQVLKAWLKAGQSLQQPEAWCSMLLHHLQHPVQKVAKESLTLLKQWLKQYPEHEALVLEGLSQQLLTPHTAVREQIYHWLQKQPLSEAAQTNLALLAADSSLSPLAHEKLLQIFPHLQAAAAEAVVPLADLPVHAETAPPPPDALQALPPWQQPWVAALQATLLRGAELQLQQPELAPCRLAEPLPVPVDTQALLEGFLSQASGPVSPVQLECLMQAVLKLPPPADATDARQYLDPLLKLLPRIDSPKAHTQWRNPWRNALVALLAWGWLEAGQLYPFSLKASQEVLLSPNFNPQAEQVLATLQALRAGAPARLSQPDSLSGWIAPESLLVRLKALRPDCITVAELEQALYALAPFPVTDWPVLERLLQALPAAFQQALRVACAPEAQAEAAAADWLKTFAEQPPQAVFLSAGWDRPRFQSQPVDQDFQIFVAALAARQNRPDYRLWPVLQALPLQQLRCDLGVDYGQLDALLDPLGQWDALQDETAAEELSDDALVELLNAFQTQSQDILAQMPKEHQRKLLPLCEMPEGFQALVQQALVAPQVLTEPLSPRLMPVSQSAFQLQLQHYRNLYPYLLNLQNTPQWLPLPALPRHWSELTPWLWPHPGQVQRLFMAALINVGEAWGQFGGLTWQAYNTLMDTYYRQKAEDPSTPEPTVSWQEIVPRLDKNDLNLALLALGQLPEIPLVEVLHLLIQPLTSKHPEQREVVLGVLAAGMATGRLLPQQVAEMLASLLGVTRKGFRYLQLALLDLQHQDVFGEYLVLQALELYFARLAPEQLKAASVLSALLDQAHALCQTLQRGIESPAARQILQNLSESKKKNVSRDKARLLLALPTLDSKTLTYRLVQHLLQRLAEPI